MNKNLEDALFDIAKVDAIMQSIEVAYLDVAVKEEDYERKCKGEFAFYALWDAVRRVADDLERLAGDSRVVDVLRAAAENYEAGKEAMNR